MPMSDEGQEELHPEKMCEEVDEGRLDWFSRMWGKVGSGPGCVTGERAVSYGHGFSASINA
jgi:hypothetical protein